MASRTADEVGPFTMVMRLIFKNILMHICLILGGTGNILTLIVLMEKRMRRASTTQYLSALTLFDLVYLISIFVINVEFIYPETRNSVINPYLNLIFYPLCDFCANTSVYLVLMFTIERYLAVAYPLHSRSWCRPSRARKIIGLTIFFCFLFTFPTFLENTIEYRLDPSLNKTMPVLTETKLYPNFKVYKFIYFWFIAVIAQFIPLTILIILNGILMKYIHKSMKNKKSKFPREDTNLSLSNFKSKIQKDASYIQLKAAGNSLNNPESLKMIQNNSSNNDDSLKKRFKKYKKNSKEFGNNHLDGHKYQINQALTSSSINENNLTESRISSNHNSKLDSSVNQSMKKPNSQHSIQLRCNVNVQQSEQNKATLLLVVTVLVFLICQIPGALLLIWDAIFSVENETPSLLYTDIVVGLNNIANGLVAINASINFILYSCFSEKFRQTFQRLFTFSKKNTPKSSTVYKNVPSRSKSNGYM